MVMYLLVVLLNAVKNKNVSACQGEKTSVANKRYPFIITYKFCSNYSASLFICLLLLLCYQTVVQTKKTTKGANASSKSSQSASLSWLGANELPVRVLIHFICSPVFFCFVIW